MYEMTPDNVGDYLRAHGRIPPHVTARPQPLGWGVSNVVMRIELDSGNHLVLKQSRRKLRTQADWHSRLERIWREAEVQRKLTDILPAGCVPAVLFEDRGNYLYAMQAAVAGHTVWKAALLEGQADETIPRRLAEILARIHTQTLHDAELQNRWSDRTVFDELRLDPFYRFLIGRHRRLKTPLNGLISETLQRLDCLVLADFSPKNVLITHGQITLVDFETAHFGDPAFDVGFFLSHLLLKTVFHAEEYERFLRLAEQFWQRYREQFPPGGREDTQEESQFASRCVKHLAGCLLARIDGKSPVDYLNRPQQELVRAFGIALFDNLPPGPDDAFQMLKRTLRTGTPPGSPR